MRKNKNGTAFSLFVDATTAPKSALPPLHKKGVMHNNKRRAAPLQPLENVLEEIEVDQTPAPAKGKRRSSTPPEPAPRAVPALRRAPSELQRACGALVTAVSRRLLQCIPCESLEKSMRRSVRAPESPSGGSHMRQRSALVEVIDQQRDR